MHTCSLILKWGGGAFLSVGGPRAMLVKRAGLGGLGACPSGNLLNFRRYEIDSFCSIMARQV